VLVGWQPIGRRCSWWPTGAAPASLIPVVAVVFICGLSDVIMNEYLFIYLFNKHRCIIRRVLEQNCPTLVHADVLCCRELPSDE